MAHTLSIGIETDIGDDLDVFADPRDFELLRERIAQKGAVLVQRNFAERDQTNENPLGATRTHYWQKAAESTRFEVVPFGAVISVQQDGVHLHWKGGVVRPVNAIWLAIPVVPEAYDTYAKHYTRDNLVFVPRNDNLALLIDPDAVSSDGTADVIYVLKKYTVHKGDDTVIPSEAELADAAEAFSQRYIDRLIERASRG